MHVRMVGRAEGSTSWRTFNEDSKTQLTAVGSLPQVFDIWATCVYTGQESIKASASVEALLGCIQAREYQGEMKAWTEKASLPIGFQDMPQGEL